MARKRILETERMLLREFDEDDVAVFYTLGSDPTIIRYTGDPAGGLTSLEHTREVLRSRPLADYQKHGFGRWACVLRASNEVIGFAGLKHLDDLNEVDIGYRLLPAHWNLGLATEASRAVIDFGFTRLGLARIIGLADPENAASIRVLKKIGMKYCSAILYQGHCVAKYVIEAPRDR